MRTQKFKYLKFLNGFCIIYISYFLYKKAPRRDKGYDRTLGMTEKRIISLWGLVRKDHCLGLQGYEDKTFKEQIP